MIGVFDSGVGGISACKELRRLLPTADIVFLADRKNAPYGTKSEDELTELVKTDVKRLRDLGASRILIACCTASTVYDRLPDKDRAIALPIIAPAARAAIGSEATLRSEYGGIPHIGVIATEATVRSHAFGRLIRALDPHTRVTEIATQQLVSLVESGGRDGALDPRGEILVDGIAERIRRADISTLILGCTHFSHLRSELQRRLRGTVIIDAARLGAAEMARAVTNDINNEKNLSEDNIRGRDRTIYT